MEREITVSVKNWLKYANSVGDYNQLHRESDRARKLSERVDGLNLEGRIAPGMFVASHVQNEGGIGYIKGIKFGKFVYEGDKLVLGKEEGKGGINYTFRRGEDVVCSVKGVREKGSESLTLLNRPIHTYNTRVSPLDIKSFLESVDCPADDKNPPMFLASLSASALLDFGRKMGFVGIHASQSFDLADCYGLGELSVEIGDEREASGGIRSYEMRWVQDGKMIGSGRSLVMPLSVK